MGQVAKSYENNQYYSIKIKNFTLNRENEKVILVKLENLREISPAYASLKLNLWKNKTSYSGKLVINSLDKRFEVTRKNQNLIHLFNDLETSIKRQLNDWKGRRLIRDYVSPRYFNSVKQEYAL